MGGRLLSDRITLPILPIGSFPANTKIANAAEVIIASLPCPASLGFSLSSIHLSLTCEVYQQK